MRWRNSFYILWVAGVATICKSQCFLNGSAADIQYFLAIFLNGKTKPLICLWQLQNHSFILKISSLKTDINRYMSYSITQTWVNNEFVGTTFSGGWIHTWCSAGQRMCNIIIWIYLYQDKQTALGNLVSPLFALVKKTQSNHRSKCWPGAFLQNTHV